MSDDGLKVFISWSGDHSKQIATVLRTWLPLLFDNVHPWMSDTDIAAGQRGLQRVESELADTRFGIIVVTTENQDAPWINFEAGALSKVVTENTEQRVVPLLVDISSPTQITGPLVQFQAKTLSRDGIRELLRSVAEVAGIAESTIDARFDVYWRKLRELLDAAERRVTKSPVLPSREPADMLDEILSHVRALRLQGEPTERIVTSSGVVFHRPRTEPGFYREEWDQISDAVNEAADRLSIDVDGFTLVNQDIQILVSHDASSDQLRQLAESVKRVTARQVTVAYTLR